MYIQLFILVFSGLYFFFKDKFKKKKNKLNELLKKNIYIISNHKSDEDDFKHNYDDIHNLVNFEETPQIMGMLTKIKKDEPLHLIIHTEGGDSDVSDSFAYLLAQANIEVYTYVPEYAMSAGTVIALAGKKIYTNWYSIFSPVDSQLDYSNGTGSEDEDDEQTFSSRHIKKLNKGKGAESMDKLQALEATDHYNDDLHILNKILKNNENKEEIIKNIMDKHDHSASFTQYDFKEFKLPIEDEIPLNIKQIFNEFKNLKKF